MLRGNQGAYSARSPRCSQTLLLQSQRTAGDVMIWLKIEDTDREHDLATVQLTLKMVPGGNG